VKIITSAEQQSVGLTRRSSPRWVQNGLSLFSEFEPSGTIPLVAAILSRYILPVATVSAERMQMGDGNCQFWQSCFPMVPMII
jgi:hypothetical protein